MLFLSIVQHYFIWHYSRAFKELFHVWLNFLWFIIHFFSIPQLMRSWFSPWKRMVEDRGNKWNLEDLAAYIIIGLISRIIGGILRTVIIALGLVCLLSAVIAGFAIHLFWIVAPLLIFSLFVIGITFFLA